MRLATQYFIMLVTLTGCVSVELGSKKVARASGVKYSAPAAPFIKASADHVDNIWRNPRNGNAISYLSDCGDNSDPSLHSIEQGVLSGLYPYTYVTQKDISYLGRAARRVQVKGTVDGVPSHVDLLIVKRNSCIYVLSYVGLEAHHNEDLKHFDAFAQRFEAP